MVLDKETARKTGELLLQIKAIKLDAQEGFKWASGWNSPIYCDNRIILSYPPIRNFVREFMSKQIDDHFIQIEAIAGVATGAIGIGMLIAEYLGLPFVYVRPEPKGHGKKNQIEGHLEPGKRVVVVEDLISTGKSSLNAVKALEAAGANVLGMMAIFSYGFKEAEENFKKANLEVHTLSNYDFLLEAAHKTSNITGKDLELLEGWHKDPVNWKK